VAYWRLFIELNTGAHTSLSIATVTKIQRPSKEQRIDTIVESARKVFCSSGFEKGSIEIIARDAGIAEGTIYRYFDSKRGLLDEVLRRHYSVLFDDILHTLPSIEGPGNRLRYLIRRTLLTISEDRGMCGLRTLYARQANNDRPSLARDQNLRMAVLMANEIKAGMKDGSFRLNTSPSIVCYMIGGAIELTEYSYMNTGKAIDIDKVTGSIWRTIHSGINSSEATAESLTNLVERFEQAADRLDPV
jgi:AcrR family transcriptional regulator